MILYFSGTGNSLHVADALNALLHERLYNMEQGQDAMPALADSEPLGIVFPVYAWGVPRIVESFLKALCIGNRYVWTVMTCGDDMGYADEVLAEVLGRNIDAAFSVQMPNTYVCLPGFDVDPAELAQKKVRETESRLPLIANSIGIREECIELTRGAAPWLKTYVLRPLFNRFLVTDKYFRANATACSSCGLCVRQCPVKDIVMVEGRPKWQKADCTGCLRCYHQCPRRAIDWSGFTRGKGQKVLS